MCRKIRLYSTVTGISTALRRMAEREFGKDLDYFRVRFVTTPDGPVPALSGVLIGGTSGVATNFRSE
ncbi:MAG: hypothetical protein QM755_03205 [Luteolibacter sp.]